jgi:tetratricopeptide (TPR) repeat protein
MWQARPVFISSTFADMQAERDYLRTHVFPELEERLRRRRVFLEWVDLRVGIATGSEPDRAKRKLQALKVCFAEVKRCRPFLIGLIGDRYGSIMPLERVEEAARDEGFTGDVIGRSVTDLEIEIGVLSDPDQCTRSLFYFRQPLPYREMPTQVAALYSDAEHDERCAALKARIKAKLPEHIHSYSAVWDREHQRVIGLEAFGRMVADDLWSAFEAEIGTGPSSEAEIPWQQAERGALADFVDDRARDFIGRRDILHSLIGLATANDGQAWAACVTGKPGSGKSALFGALYRFLHERDVFLLAHAAGASVNAPSVDSMLRRWIGEIAGALRTDPGLADNADPDTVDAAFARLLGQMAQRRRVVVLIDALDQFEATTRARFVTWLPRLWPGNARLVATATPDEASKALADRPGMETLVLPPLDAAEARDIIGGTSDGIRKGICGRYHRTFEPEVIDALLAKRGPDGPASANPLWLVLAVEELNLLDADDFARVHLVYTGKSRLRALMLDIVAGLPADIPGLYAHTFDRAKELFGAPLVRGFLGLIAVSRGGWRESDFRALLPRASGENWDELKFAQVRRFFRGQIRRRGALAQWDFNHAQMRLAVRGWLAAQGVSEQGLHTLIADRMLSFPPDDPLHISETMVHLFGSEDWRRAAAFYADESLQPPEVEGATLALADEIIAATSRFNRMLGAAELDNDVAANVAERIHRHLEDIIDGRAPIEVRLPIFRWCHAAFNRLVKREPQNALWRYMIPKSHRDIGEMLLLKGQLEPAIEEYRASLTAAQRLLDAAPDQAEFKYNLANSFGRIGEAFRRQGNLESALRSYRSGIALLQPLVATGVRDKGWQHELAVQRYGLGKIFQARGELGAAIVEFNESLAGMNALAAAEPDDPRLQAAPGISHTAIGETLLAQGDLEAALCSYSAALKITERAATRDPTNTRLQHSWVVCLSHIADIQELLGERPAALKTVREARKIIERLIAADPHHVVWQQTYCRIMTFVGELLAGERQLAPALESYRATLHAVERLSARDPSNYQNQCDLYHAHAKIGELYLAKKEFAAAFDYFERSLEIVRNLACVDESNTVWKENLAIAHSRMGMAQSAQAKLPAALVSHLTAAAVLEQLCVDEPSNAENRFRLSSTRMHVANALSFLGNLEEAQQSYHEAQRGLDRLVESNPQNTEWLFALANLHAALGLNYRLMANLAEALRSFRSAVAILVQLLQKWPNDPDCLNNLRVCREQIALLEGTVGGT